MLSTQRLTLRGIQESDASTMADLLADDEAGVRMTERLPWPATVEAAREWIRLRLGPNEHVFAIEVEGELAGAIGFILMGEVVGVGYWLGKGYRGKRYASEALAAVLTYAKTLGARVAVAETFLDNEASQRVLLQCGFERKGVHEKEVSNRAGVQQLMQFAATLE